MAITEEEAKLRRRAQLSYQDIKRNNPAWSDIQVDDYLDKQNEINILVEEINTLAEQVAENTETNEAQQLEIDSNTTGVATNAGNITTVTDNFNTHDASNSEHGVTGDNVGTGDFAQTAIGGVVLLADLVADAVDSAVSVDSPDATAAPAAYDQTQAQTVVTLANEMKGDINQLVSDLNDAITQLNDLLQQMKDANQMNTVQVKYGLV